MLKLGERRDSVLCVLRIVVIGHIVRNVRTQALLPPDSSMPSASIDIVAPCRSPVYISRRFSEG